MLSLNIRIDLLDRLGKYMLSDDEQWQHAQALAIRSNSWFTEESVKLAITNIATSFLNKAALQKWVTAYQLPSVPKKVGIVMAGNIPLVGFHDFLCGFICGHDLYIKLSSKDEILLKHIISKLTEWEAGVAEYIHIAELLKGCEAYIATGSNNTARYFEQYFGKYPHIIRKNRTSVAILTGEETDAELKELANDIFTYFGLGCRNISQLYVPRGYDFSHLLEVFSAYDLTLHHKYKNNYDYYLAIYLLNKVPYLTNGSILLVENNLPFSPVSVLHYQYYDDRNDALNDILGHADIQCIVANDILPFGHAQHPSLTDYADGVDTMAFLCSL